MASQLRSLNPTIKLLFYFNSILSYGDCYTSGPNFEDHPSYYLKNDNGIPYGGPQRHAYDLTQSPVRDFVADSSTSVPGQGTLLDGVMADNANDGAWEGMSTARYNALVRGHHASLNQTRSAVQMSMRPGALLIANALTQYATPPDHGLALLPFVDGLMLEHFNSFESLDRVTGALSPAAFALTARLVREASAAGKVVLIKAWPGPICQPIGALGPSWCGPRSAPTTHAGRAEVAGTALEAALAAYLILATDYTFFSFSWWYTSTDGAFPCDDDGSCSAPGGWYPELSKRLGPPLGDASLNGTVYSRAFQFASVHFDATNVSAGHISWVR